MKTVIFIAVLILSLNTLGQKKEILSDEVKKSFINATENKNVTNSDFYSLAANQLREYKHTGLGTIQTFDTRYQGVKGSQYLYRDWKKGAVLIVGYEKPQIVYLNYDCINDQLLFRHEDGQASSFIKELITSFAIQDSAFNDQLAYFVRLPSKKETIEYYQVLFSKDILVLKNHRRILHKADYQRAYNPDVRFDEYVPIDEYFVKKGDTEPEKIQFSRKTIENLLPEMKNQISEYSKVNGSKLKSKEELISLLQFLDNH